MKVYDYFHDFFTGLRSLLVGMGTTIQIFFRKKTTEPYPAHRADNYVSPRFRGRLSMPTDENGQNRCIACGLCQMNCPNETIHIETRTETTPDGKPKKVLERYTYDLGCCLFCQICVRVCPQQAIVFTPAYENAVFERDQLMLTLNTL